MNLIQVEEIKCRDKNDESLNPKQGFNIINTSFRDLSMKMNELNNKKNSNLSYHDDSKEAELLINASSNLSKSPQHRPSIKIVIDLYLIM